MLSLRVFIILIHCSGIFCIDPNICTGSESTKCSGGNVTIHVIKNNKLLTASPTSIYYNGSIGVRVECGKYQYKSKFPMDEVSFWETGDVMHIPSLSTFPKSRSCIELNCHNGKEFHKLQTCITKPELPICSSGKEVSATPNDLQLEKSDEHYNIEIMAGDHRSVVNVQGQPIAISCDETEKILNISVLNDGVSDLAVHGNVLHLVHRHSPIALPNRIQSPKFCLSLDGEYGPIKSTYCFPDPKKILEKSCHGKHCVKKCCQPGYIIDAESFSCVPAFNGASLWEPKFYDLDSVDWSSGSVYYELVLGMPHCSDFYPVSTVDMIKLLTNGTLYLENGNLFFSPTRYCIDNFKEGDNILEQAYVCFPEESPSAAQSTCAYIGQNLYPVLLLISSAFLMLTIITYALVPELHAKIQSKCLLSSISALMVAYIALAMGQLYSYLLTQTSCICLGICIQFSVLASFFWLNVMCYDIWTTLRSLKPSRDSISNPRKKFLLYSLYGWGCPFIISSVTAIMQFVVGPNRPNLFLPKIGETDCFFSAKDPISRWIYLYSFICAILVLNLIYFLHLAIVLIRAQHLSEVTLGKKGQYREWIKLYIKLFFVMGVSWLFEAVSWHNEVCAVWIATDIINALRGFFIFVIFVCKKDVYLKLKNRIKPGLSQVPNTTQASFLRSSTKMSTRVGQNQPNSIGLLETTTQTNSQAGDEITTVSTTRN